MDYDIIDLPRVKLLNEDETRKYIKKAQKGDEEALEKLVKHNLRLVLKVTYRFKNSEYNLQDLFQIGVIGLIKAIKDFDLERKVKLSTYAVTKILGQIKLHIRDDGIIKVSRSLKKIAHIVARTREELEYKLGREPSISEIEEETGINREKIVQALEANRTPSSIYQTVYDNEGSKLHLIDRIREKRIEDKLENIDRIVLLERIRSLDKRSRKIIYYRYFQDMTQQEIAEKIGVSQVQVSRLEKKILKKLKEAL